MIRTLFLAAALLVPGLANAGAPSAGLSVQIVPSGAIACDVGPNYASSVPAPALAAGFTHCALNADFTSNATDSHGISFSNLNTWLYNCGGNNAVAPNNTTFMAVWNSYTAINNAACGQGVTLTTDGGVQVVQIQWKPSDYNDHNAKTLEFSWPTGENGQGPHVPGGSAGGPNGTGLPQAVYVEILWRMTPQSWQNWAGDSNPFDWWQDSCNGCNQGQAGQEIDFAESHVSNYNGSTMQLDQNTHGAPTFSFRMDVTTYHKWGNLITQDGNGNTSECVYVDDVLQGCNQGSGYQILNKYRNIALWNGDYNCYGPTPPGGCATNPVTSFFKNIRVFVCPSYWSTNCYGNLVTSAADKKTRFAWLKDIYKEVSDWIIPPARADRFDPPWLGVWACGNGKYGIHDDCMPPELKGKDWWAECVPGRGDCVSSDTAFTGRYEAGHAVRGPGYCYTGQPYTCSSEGKLPQ